MSASKPVVIRGVSYPSHTAAARALGVAPSCVDRARARGTLDFVGLGRANPVRIRGVDYPSQAAAARALGVDRSVVGQALAKGVAERTGLGRNVPVRVNGRDFPTQAAAAEAVGIPRQTLQYQVQRAQYLRRPVFTRRGHEVELVE